ncbi:MAG: kinase/pyrophosphorylase [Thermanaerothrix sp.]|nr:kinase/pyrophosphorylase [Thermanaerothrix sp.]
MSPDLVELYVVSDFTGETAEHVARAAVSQFGPDAVNLVRFRYVSDEERGMEVLRAAKERSAVLVCTLVDHGLRRWFVKMAQEQGNEVVDILGPILEILGKRLNRQPLETPGLLRRMDEEYFRRVKAIEFAIRCDDGRSPEMLDQAELVVVGVSRTSKTPLSMYLAHKGVATANVPLVPEAEPPAELFKVPAGRVVGLVIAPEKLIQIRRERLKVLGLDADVSSYAQWERVEEELGFAKSIMKRIGCRVFDVTNRAIEETAQEILDYIGK